MTGKWHVGQNHGVVPWKRGFDRSLNSPAGGYYFPENKERLHPFLNGRALTDDAPELPKNWVQHGSVDGLVASSSSTKGGRPKKPIFIYLAHNAPHFPLQAPADEIAKFRGKYKMGWDKLREQRNAREKESRCGGSCVGIIAPAGGCEGVGKIERQGKGPL